MSFKIISYNNIYDKKINQLERIIFQGKSILLRIIKNQFLDRAIVFKKYFPILAISDKGIVIATCIGAQTTLKINDIIFSSGIGFDVKVNPNYRNKGIAKMLAKHTYKNFFKPEGLIKNFITLKKNNRSVIQLVFKVNKKIHLNEFIYLSIPTKSRVVFPATLNGNQQHFFVELFNKEDVNLSYYKILPSGLGYFNTHKMYQLEVFKISWIYKLGLAILRKIQPKKSIYLPNEGEIITFATLFNHTQKNIIYVNDLLSELESSGINYLMVCCKKNDAIFNALKSSAINCMEYYMLCDFPVNKTDEVTIDVRCL
jgi:hypothetical protein